MFALLSGCAGQNPTVFAITYHYAEGDRVSAERHADRQAQDACYFEGYVYASRVGAAKIVRDAGQPAGEVEVTQSFDCTGMRGEG